MYHVARYIVQNPGRAGLVQSVDDYPFWGSTISTKDELVGSTMWSEQTWLDEASAVYRTVLDATRASGSGASRTGRMASTPSRCFTTRTGTER